MPARLRPTAPIASRAILVGDPGRALLLAQALLDGPKMSNHARGLWGYSGETVAGDELTIQATGMGGPSAAVVLGDLAGLGVRRAIRIGTATALGEEAQLGEILVVREASAWEEAHSSPVGRRPSHAPVAPDAALTARVGRALGDGARDAAVASLDRPHSPGGETPPGAAADMQTATLLSRGAELGVALAAVLIISEAAATDGLDEDALAERAVIAGEAATEALGGNSNPRVEG
jgi:uridine phosphorylase